MPGVEAIIQSALSRAGTTYVYGAEARALDPAPLQFDCSELIEWACARAGLSPTMPDWTVSQHLHCAKHGTMIDIGPAIATRGALLITHRLNGQPMVPTFQPPYPDQAHIAISLGDGNTIEARSTQAGVGVFSTANRSWTHAALIPGASYAAPTPPPAPPTPPPPAPPTPPPPTPGLPGSAGPRHGRPYLRQGARSTDVAFMQQLLIATGEAELAAVWPDRILRTGHRSRRSFVSDQRTGEPFREHVRRRTVRPANVGLVALPHGQRPRW